MKKLLIAFTILFGAMFASCSNSTDTTKTTDSIETVVDTVEIVDTVAVDTIL